MKFFYTLLSIVFAGNIFGQTINSTSLPKVNSENSYYSSLNTDLNEISKIEMAKRGIYLAYQVE